MVQATVSLFESNVLYNLILSSSGILNIGFYWKGFLDPTTEIYQSNACFLSVIIFASFAVSV